MCHLRVSIDEVADPTDAIFVPCPEIRDISQSPATGEGLALDTSLRIPGPRKKRSHFSARNFYSYSIPSCGCLLPDTSRKMDVFTRFHLFIPTRDPLILEFRCQEALPRLPSCAPVWGSVQLTYPVILPNTLPARSRGVAP